MTNGEETTKISRTVWDFYTDSKDEWRWRASDFNNGKTLAVSSEGYKDKRDAEKCAVRFGWSPE